jgi:hypothetical protein
MLAEQHHITPEQAAERLLKEAARFHLEPSPADQLIGAFSSPEDRQLIDEAMAFAQRNREIDLKRDFEL